MQPGQGRIEVDGTRKSKRRDRNWEDLLTEREARCCSEHQGELPLTQPFTAKEAIEPAVDPGSCCNTAGLFGEASLMGGQQGQRERDIYVLCLYTRE